MQPGQKGVEDAKAGCKHPLPANGNGYRSRDERQKVEGPKKDYSPNSSIDQ